MEHFLRDIDPKKPINLTEYAETHKAELEDLLKANQNHWMDLPNVLMDPAEMKEKERYLDMAYQLQAEVKEKKYPMDYNHRQQHMGEKYHELMENNVALFRIAIMEELDKYEDILSIFKSNRNDPVKLRKEMEALVKKDFENDIDKFIKQNKNSRDPDVQLFIQSYKPPTALQPSTIEEITDETPITNANESTTKSDTIKPRSKEELYKKYGKKK